MAAEVPEEGIWSRSWIARPALRARALRPVQLQPRSRRIVDFREGEAVDVEGLKALIRVAVLANVAGKKARKST